MKNVEKVGKGRLHPCHMMEPSELKMWARVHARRGTSDFVLCLGRDTSQIAKGHRTSSYRQHLLEVKLEVLRLGLPKVRICVLKVPR